MKAVVLHQPSATLVALGVKTIETRPSPPNGPMRPEGVRGLPGLAIEPGERIAIVAGAKEPTRSSPVGDWQVVARDWADGTSLLLQHYADGVPGAPDEAPLPLGAVVCTTVVTDALPMVVPAWEPAARDSICLPDDDTGSPLTIGRWTHPGPAGFWSHYDSDQLPYGDFAPGRWGWLLADVERTPPVPCKGRQGVFLLPDDVAEQVAS